MTDRSEALRALKEKVEAGTISSEDMQLAEAAIGENYMDAGRAYDGSLDAAHALHEAVLPGWWWSMTAPMRVRVFDALENWHDSGPQHNHARAWLIAILSALVAQEEAGQ